MLTLTAPRVQAANAYMSRKLGLDSATLKRSNAALAKALQGGQRLTRKSCVAFFGNPASRRMARCAWAIS